jgi:hypothetical protein
VVITKAVMKYPVSERLFKGIEHLLPQATLDEVVRSPKRKEDNVTKD